jgi:hypothetical protein
MEHWHRGIERQDAAIACGTSECGGLQRIDGDFRDVIRTHCSRCQGTGEECLVVRLCEVAEDKSLD